MEQLENCVNSKCTRGDGATREVTVKLQQRKYIKPLQIKYFRIALRGKYSFIFSLSSYIFNRVFEENILLNIKGTDFITTVAQSDCLFTT